MSKAGNYSAVGNAYNFIGNVGQDAELREFGENSVINFSLARNDKFENAGLKTERTTWIRCEVWNKPKLAAYVKAGKKLAISGVPYPDAYVNNKGELIKILNVNVLNLEFLDKKEQQAAPQQNTNQQQTPTGQQTPQNNQQQVNPAIQQQAGTATSQAMAEAQQQTPTWQQDSQANQYQRPAMPQNHDDLPW